MLPGTPSEAWQLACRFARNRPVRVKEPPIERRRLITDPRLREEQKKQRESDGAGRTRRESPKTRVAPRRDRAPGVPQRRSTMDIMFTVRRLQELGQKARVPLLLCYIDQQKAYDSVLEWQVLARFGVQPQMLRVAREFHERMRACVPNDDGVCWSGSR